MALSIKDYIIIMVVQVTHQGDARYGTYRSIQCSCMSLVLVSQILFRSPGQWNKLDLDSTLRKEDQLFISLGIFKYLGMKIY